MTKVVLVRHAEPLADDDTPAAQWPLTESGRRAARRLGTVITSRSETTTVWTSPERRARDTARLAFPATETAVRTQLGEVKKPWYASTDEHADAVADYLTGHAREGWERRADVLLRMGRLTSDLASVESLALVSHGVLLTTWIDHHVGLDDPVSFWCGMRMPDAWTFDLGKKSVERIG